MGSLARMCCVAVVAAVVATVVARPNGEVTQRDARGQTIVDSSDPFEARSQGQGSGPVQTLAYYGGAKGQYLLIHPTGVRTVSRTPPPLRAKPGHKPGNKPGHKPDKEDDEDVGMANEEEDNDNDGDNESVAIGPPPDNASVAEAKPVGLAIAGPGGVAVSKPVAQAIVGPEGLAVAAPVATAIAGVKVAGLPGAAAAAGKEEEDAAARRKVFFDPQTNRLHATPLVGHQYYPVNLY